MLSITNESREVVLKYLTQLNTAPVTYTIGLGGGHGNYPARGIPAAWLIGADGKVVWQGHPSSLSDKVIEEELRKVKLDDAQKESRAGKALEKAEALIGQKRFLQAQQALEAMGKEHKGTEAAKKAEEKLKEMDRDSAAKKEIAAQKLLDKIVGGIDLPKEKLKGKEREAKAVQLEAFIKKNREDAPGAAEIASMWVKVMQEDWKAEK